MLNEMGQAMRMTEFEEFSAAPYWAVLRKRLLRIALALTRSRSDAEDLVQQTLLTLLARKPERAEHVGYARQTMLHLWLDHQRSLRRRLRRVAQLAATSRHRQVDRDEVSMNDQYRRVQRAIETLPPRQRATLVLRLVEELDYAKIAAVLGCSVQTVRANLHLGRRRVRRLVGETP